MKSLIQKTCLYFFFFFFFWIFGIPINSKPPRSLSPFNCLVFQIFKNGFLLSITDLLPCLLFSI
ncbi:hypothetical protein BY458DRAFT_144174 [Sporodiniella umbellata]|nr:hypothetical protein BY458DRAFT_144174 [Sporodiniella umbellata]